MTEAKTRDITIISATKARELSDKHYPSQIPEIAAKIIAETKKGNYEIKINNLDKKDKAILEGLGYTIYIYSGDERDSGYITISW